MLLRGGRSWNVVISVTKSYCIRSAILERVSVRKDALLTEDVLERFACGVHAIGPQVAPRSLLLIGDRAWAGSRDWCFRATASSLRVEL